MNSGSRVQTVLRNAAFVTISSVISQVIMAVTAIFVVRYLGLSLYSDYSTAMLFMGMFSVLGRLGFNRVFLRECSREVELTANYFSATLLLNSGLALLGFAVVLVIAYFRYDSDIFILTILLGISLMLMTLEQVPTKVFQAHQKMHLRAIVNMVCSITYAAVFFLAIYLKVSVFVLAGLHLLVNLFRFVFNTLLAVRLSRPVFDLVIFKKLIVMGKHFCAIDVMLCVYSSANGFILVMFNIGNQAGIYNAAARIFAMFQMIGQIIDTAICPALYNASDDSVRLLTGLKLVIRYYTAAGILIGVICIGRAQWIIITFFKAEFLESARILSLLGLALTVRFLFIPLNHIVYAFNKERFMMIAMTYMAISLVLMCLLLIPFYGAMGATISFVVVEIAMTLVCLIAVERLLSHGAISKLLIMPFLSGALTLLLLFFTRNHPWTGLLLSPLVYISVLFVFGYYHLSEVFNFIRLFLQPKKD